MLDKEHIVVAVVEHFVVDIVVEDIEIVVEQIETVVEQIETVVEQIAVMTVGNVVVIYVDIFEDWKKTQEYL